MCTLPIPAGIYLAYVSPIHSIFFMVKIVVRSLPHPFIYKIRSFFNFRNYLCKNRDVYPSNSSWNVFGIRFSNTQYFFMVKIVVRSRRHLFIYKIRSFFNFRNYLCKNGDVYPSNSGWNVFSLRFSNTQYCFLLEEAL